jgi:phospholipid-transporting ATPase
MEMRAQSSNLNEELG